MKLLILAATIFATTAAFAYPDTGTMTCAQAQAYVTEGYRFVVDMDLAKFFDRVNHDKLMARVAARIPDRRVLRLIRSYLTAGVLNNGLFEVSREGTPQGDRSRLCSRISCWTNWIANLSAVATASCAARTTATSTSAAKRLATGSWPT